MTGTKEIRILLVDDHAIVREGLRTLLASEPDMTVIADTGDGRSALALARKHAPDVVLMDVGMPGLNGIDATRQISTELPMAKVLCLSMHKEKRIVSAVLRAGAAGYLVKHCASRELVDAIHAVVSGKTYLSPEIAGEVVNEMVDNAPPARGGLFGRLSEREREVLQLIAEGRSTKEIAAKLHLSEKTIAAHRLNIMEKVQLHSVADLTRYAIREGLVEP
jgi:DNA-binding NarL/FixJ family response regulator